jgi:hypothetical protein
MYEVWIKDVLSVYYNYCKQAMRKDNATRPFWMIDPDRSDFEKRWFTDKGIELIKVTNQDPATKKETMITIKLRFASKKHYAWWLLQWG